MGEYADMHAAIMNMDPPEGPSDFGDHLDEQLDAAYKRGFRDARHAAAELAALAPAVPPDRVAALAALTAEQERLGLYEQPAAPAEPDVAARWDFMLWMAELMRLADVYHDASTAAAARVRLDVQRHASAAGMHWRAKAMIESTRKPPAAAPSVAPEPVAGCAKWTPREQQEQDDAARALNATPVPGSPEAFKMAEALAGLGTMSPRLRKLYDDAAAVLRAANPPRAPAAKYSDLVSDGGMDPRTAAPSVAPEPVAWTLQSELDAAQTTCSAHLWFTNPRNSAWTALFTREKIAAHPPRAPLTRREIESVMTEHYPLDCLLRENVDAFEACVRDLEAAHGISAAAIGAAK